MRLLILLLALNLTACNNPANPPPSPSPVPPAPSPQPPPLDDPPCGLDATETVQLMRQDETLIGGVPADPVKWPASVYAQASGSACSSTVIGDRVLLSAGHCMGNGKEVTFSAGANKYKARCNHHPEYPGNGTADWALCLIDRPVTGVIFERLSTKFAISKGDTVRLTGYGCVNPGGGGGNDGIFRIGVAEVVSTPSGKNYDVKTKGGAALCFGDSGGAGYLEYSDGSREIFGVNSRGNIKTESYLPSVAMTTMQAFALDWADKHGVKICGIHPDAKACRDQKPPEPPPGPKYDFEIRSKVACVRGKMNPGHETKKDGLVEGLKKVLESFK